MSEGFDNDEMKEIVQDFLQEASEMLEGLDNYFVQLENNPEDRTLLNEIFRTAHSIKGSAGFIGLNRIVEVAHHAENVLNQLRTGNMRAEPAVVDIILEAMDALKVLVNEVRTGEQADVDIEGINMKLDLLLQWGEDTHTESSSGEEGAAEGDMAAAVREEQALDHPSAPQGNTPSEPPAADVPSSPAPPSAPPPSAPVRPASGPGFHSPGRSAGRVPGGGGQCGDGSPEGRGGGPGRVRSDDPGRDRPSR